MSTKLKCLIVDDEPLARKGLTELIGAHPNLSLGNTAKSAEEAISVIQNGGIDLVFLDIQMSGMSGIEMIHEIKKMPLLIFTTAHAGYAVESYELNASDYLLKPFSQERFNAAIQKVLEKITFKQVEQTDWFIRSSGQFFKIATQDISYISGLQNYVKIHFTNGKTMLVHSPLKTVHTQLSDGFVMVHKSYLVNFTFISSVSRNKVFLKNDVTLPLSRIYKPGLLAKFKTDL